MPWFKRTKAGILTDLSEKNDVPEGQWVKCPNCDEIINRRELSDNRLVCPKCAHHFNMNGIDYLRLLYDEGRFELFDENLKPTDRLDFTDRKDYPSRLKDAQRKSGLSDAIRAAMGEIGGHRTSTAVMEFSFIGGSMGSVVGEVISRAIQRACTEDAAMLIISQSGGARMMEGALSLMQMAKTSAQLTRLAEKRLPYISLMTNPTTGGVSASFAMLGDFNLAEPKALIGFAGPRVIRETIGQDLPEGFQRAEFILEHGFLDRIVDRRNLKKEISTILDHVMSTR
jgi:acetyl-CoA carboxylase carboxyl transferase subunit beta